jgi:hypothetical protein
MSTARADASPPAKNGLPKSIPNSMREDESFRFLDLPKELRLMVYERIPVRISERHYNHKVLNEPHPVSFIVPCTSVGILATCRQIQAEASAIMSKKMTTILNTPLRVIVGTRLLPHLHDVRLGPFVNYGHYLYIIEGMQMELVDADDVEEARGQAMSRYPRKWFLHAEKQRQLYDSSDAPYLEIGIRNDIAILGDEDCVSVLLAFASGDIEYNNGDTDMEYKHHLVEDLIADTVLQELDGWFCFKEGLWNEDQPRTGDRIGSEEYKNEWRAEAGLTFPST